MTILLEPNLKVVRRDKKGAFRLTSQMEYVWRTKRCIVVIPKNEVTNFASIPQGFRAFISVNGAHRLPAILHDYLYSKAGIIRVIQVIDGAGGYFDLDEPQGIYYSRKDADKEFRCAMRAEGVGRFKASSMYRGVRIFGGKAWRRG